MTTKKVLYTSRNSGKTSIKALSQILRDAFNTPEVLQKLVCAEVDRNNVTWYTIEPLISESFNGRNYIWPKMEAWAKETFGEPADAWDTDNFIWPVDGRWFMNNRKFWFRYEKDRTMFVLKFS